MKIRIGIKIGLSSLMILMVFMVSAFMMMTGALELRSTMSRSLEKSEQMNMLLQYNILSSRITLLAKETILHREKVHSDGQI